jgi:hypothetical protein
MNFVIGLCYSRFSRMQLCTRAEYEGFPEWYAKTRAAIPNPPIMFGAPSAKPRMLRAEFFNALPDPYNSFMADALATVTKRLSKRIVVRANLVRAFAAFKTTQRQQLESLVLQPARQKCHTNRAAKTQYCPSPNIEATKSSGACLIL